MPIFRVLKSFKWAFNGYQVKAFEAGQEVALDDLDLIEVGVREKWISPILKRSKQPDENKMIKRSPENK